jgi:Family of unknown function (DUF6677)
MNATRREQAMPAGDAWTMFLLGFVPGVNHFRLHQGRRALFAALSCAIVFFAGYPFVTDRLFYYALLSPDRDSAMAPLLRHVPLLNLPESLNLFCAAIGTTLAYVPDHLGERLARMPRGNMEHIGAFLTGASGMLAAFWAADAFFVSRCQRAKPKLVPPRVNPALAAALSWIVPGLGHVRAGQRDKGLLVGACVLLVFLVGLVASGGHAVDRAQMPVWWMGQNLFGGGSLFCAIVTAPWHMTHDSNGLDLGIVLTTVAGMMNLVVMVDAYAVAERSALPLQVSPEASA